VWIRNQFQRLMVISPIILKRRQEQISLCYHIYYRNNHI
jgi:hypothetical protein